MRLRSAILAGILAAGASAVATSAQAATWLTPRTTPRLTELVAVDKTGEANWIYGQEDVSGDGLGVFAAPEQSIDLRTAYAATDATRFWVRVYVSEANAVPATTTVYVFIDADKNPATGGKTSSVDLSPSFTADTSPGGYEYVIGLLGNGTVSNVWQWRTVPAPQYTVVTVPTPADAVGEIGHDLDAIRIGNAQHAYVQGAVTLGLVGLTPPCDANLYVRSANPSGASDLDMSFATSCVPVDANGDKVPDILVPPPGCTTDAQCPQGGVCQNGTCALAPPCVTDASCANGFVCSADGRCVPKGGAACTTNAQCNGLVCVNKACVACTQGGTECGAGARCAANGTCVGSTGTTPLSPTAQVEGGAFNCGVTSGSGDGFALVAMGSLMLLLRVRRRRR